MFGLSLPTLFMRFAWNRYKCAFTVRARAVTASNMVKSNHRQWTLVKNCLDVWLNFDVLISLLLPCLCPTEWWGLFLQQAPFSLCPATCNEGQALMWESLPVNELLFWSCQTTSRAWERRNQQFPSFCSLNLCPLEESFTFYNPDGEEAVRIGRIEARGRRKIWEDKSSVKHFPQHLRLWTES